MRTHKLLLVPALAVLLLGSVACSDADDMSGSAVQTEGDPGVGPGDEPVAPEEPQDPGIKAPEPGAGGGGSEQPGIGDPAKGSAGAQTLEEALALHKDSERLNREIILNDCGSTGCEGLDDFVAYIESGCDDGCSPSVEKFLDNLSSAQKQAGIVPATFPTKRELTGVVDDAAEFVPAEPGDEAKGDEPADEPGAALDPAELDAVVATVVSNLRASAGTDYATVTWKAILAEIRQTVTDPAQALEMLNEIQATLEDGFKSAAGDETARALLEGEAVAPAEAADAIEAVWAERPEEG